MSFDETNFDTPDGDAPLPEESNNNRTFMIAVGILGGVILISIACLVGVYLFGLRNRTAAVPAADVTATANAANAIINQALTSTASAAILPTATSSPVPTAVVSIPTSTITPDPALLTSEAAGPAGADGTPAAATATVGAALTKAAEAQLTVIPTTTALSALPNGGFADDIGLPGFVVMGLAFVIVILLARRLRTAPSLSR